MFLYLSIIVVTNLCIHIDTKANTIFIKTTLVDYSICHLGIFSLLLNFCSTAI